MSNKTVSIRVSGALVYTWDASRTGRIRTLTLALDKELKELRVTAPSEVNIRHPYDPAKDTLVVT